jgi:hypothetical protein
MEPADQGVPKLGQVIQIDEGKIQEHLEVVRSTVEETWNAMLDAEAVVFLPCRAIRTDRGSKRYQVGVTTSGTYRRKRVKSH